MKVFEKTINPTKRFILLLMISFSVVNLYSQTELSKRNTVSAHIAPGLWLVPTLGGSGMLPVYNVSINYFRNLNECWAFGGGVEILMKVFGHRIDGHRIEMISVPIQLRHNFNQSFYLHFGTSADIMDRNFGLSGRLGAGFERENRNGFVFSVNPYVRYGFFDDMRHMLLGISLGVGYRF